MWEWKLAVWWDRDNKGRAREKFANSKIEARSVEHGKLLPPSIFCYYQASGHRPIGSVASSWVEVLCFDLNYQWFKYPFWTERVTKKCLIKLEIFRVFNGLLLELILAFIRHICVHRLIFRRWSDCNCKCCNVLCLSKDNQSWQTHVARWEGSWIDEISGVHLQHFFGFADSLVCKTIREICWVGIDPDGILLYCLDDPFCRFHPSSSGVYSRRAGNIRLVWKNTSCVWQKKTPNLIIRKPEQHHSISWKCVYVSSSS